MLRPPQAALVPLGGAATVLSNLAASGLSTISSEEAVALQRRAVAIAPADSFVHSRLGERLLQLSGKEAEAEAALRVALALGPRDGHSLNSLGTVLQAQHGRWREAQAAYQACLELLPTSGDAYHNLGTVKQRLGLVGAA